MTAPEPTDLALLEAWRNGDRERGNVLFRRHVRAISRFFRSKVSAGAEDLVQRTFLGLVEGKDRLVPTSSFRAYLFGIARNVLLMHLRIATRDRKRFDPESYSIIDVGGAPAKHAVRHQEQALVLDALQRLPVDYQIALEMHYWEGLTVAEIAGVLGDAPGTIKSRLSRGRGLLRDALGKSADRDELLQSAVEDLDRWVRSLPEVVRKTGGPADEA